MDRVFTYLVTPTKDRSNYIVDSTPIYQQKPKEKHISFAEKTMYLSLPLTLTHIFTLYMRFSYISEAESNSE